MSDVPRSRVELHMSCQKLASLDVMSKSDPMVVVFQQSGKSWIEVGRTEALENQTDASFVTAIEMDYLFEVTQHLLIVVYDVDDPKKLSDLSKQQKIGQVQCTMADIVSAGSAFTKPLQSQDAHGHARGDLTVRAEESSALKVNAFMHVTAESLDKKDLFGKSDPYLVLNRVTADGTKSPVYRSEVIKNVLNCAWSPFEVSLGALCGGDANAPLIVDVYDWDSDGSHDLIGSFQTTTNDIQHSLDKPFELINEKKKHKKKSYKNSGKVFFHKCDLIRVYSFLDFIAAGCELNFCVAVDFTASNGRVTQATSLHYINPYQPNEYQRAISAVGSVIEGYDNDRLFPCFGYGGKLPNGTVSHRFALNGVEANPECVGISGILQAYQGALTNVGLWGPTNMAPTINYVNGMASKCTDGSKYFVLLIITDGAISDMAETVKALVNASRNPVSVIIVGVGGADFSSMEQLDGDDAVLKSGSTAAARDIVQFVPFRKYHAGDNAALARDVLAEVPKQVVDYMKQKKISPDSIKK